MKFFDRERVIKCSDRTLHYLREMGYTKKQIVHAGIGLRQGLLVFFLRRFHELYLYNYVRIYENNDISIRVTAYRTMSGSLYLLLTKWRGEYSARNYEI